MKECIANTADSIWLNVQLEVYKAHLKATLDVIKTMLRRVQQRRGKPTKNKTMKGCQGWFARIFSLVDATC